VTSVTTVVGGWGGENWQHKKVGREGELNLTYLALCRQNWRIIHTQGQLRKKDSKKGMTNQVCQIHFLKTGIKR